MSLEKQDIKYDFFLNKIALRENFTFTKINHGFWDILATKEAPSQYYFDDNVFVEIVKILRKLDTKPNFYFGVCDGGESSNVETKRLIQINRKNIKYLLPQNYVPLEGQLWRIAAGRQEIVELIPHLQSHHTIFVMPCTHRRLPEYLGVEDYLFIEIPQFTAWKYKEEILSEIIYKHQKNSIILMQGSYTATWICWYMHNFLNNCYVIDMGRAVDVFLPSGECQYWISKDKLYEFYRKYYLE